MTSPFSRIGTAEQRLLHFAAGGEVPQPRVEQADAPKPEQEQQEQVDIGVATHTRTEAAQGKTEQWKQSLQSTAKLAKDVPGIDDLAGKLKNTFAQTTRAAEQFRRDASDTNGRLS